MIFNFKFDSCFICLQSKEWGLWHTAASHQGAINILGFTFKHMCCTPGIGVHMVATLALVKLIRTENFKACVEAYKEYARL